MAEVTTSNGSESPESKSNGSSAKAAKGTRAKARAQSAGNPTDILFSWPAFDALGGELKERLSGGGEKVKETFGKLNEGLTQVQTTASETMEALRESYGLAGAGMREYQLKVIEFAQADANRYFEAARAMLGAKSIPEALEIQANAVRHHVEQQVRQLRTLSELTVNATRGSVEPVTGVLSSAFKKARGR